MVRKRIPSGPHDIIGQVPNVTRLGSADQGLRESPQIDVSPQVRCFQARLLLSVFRKITEEEIKSIADLYRHNLPKPSDFDSRVARISIALYFLDSFDTMQKLAVSKKDGSLYPLLAAIIDPLLAILKQNYYSSPMRDIVDRSVAFLPDFVRAARACGIPIHDSLEDAVKEYKLTLTERVDAKLATDKKAGS